MQIKNRKISVVQYYKEHHDYDINQLPILLRYRVTAHYMQDLPLEVACIERLIGMFSKFNVNNRKEKEPSVVCDLKEDLPIRGKRNILRSPG